MTVSGYDHLESSNQSDETYLFIWVIMAFLGANMVSLIRGIFMKNLPFLFYFITPDLLKPVKLINLILNTDIAPTILDFAGSKIPDYYVGSQSNLLLIPKRSTNCVIQYSMNTTGNTISQ